MKNSVTDLLRLLRKQNDESDYDGLLKQVVYPPDPLSEVVALGESRAWELSPMLTDRFRFAGEWKNAAASQRWLSLAQIRALSSNKKILGQIALRIEHWPSSLLAMTPRDCVVLFGIDEEDQEETYLVWREDREPLIATYIASEEQVFTDFERYLDFLTAE